MEPCSGSPGHSGRSNLNSRNRSRHTGGRRLGSERNSRHGLGRSRRDHSGRRAGSNGCHERAAKQCPGVYPGSTGGKHHRSLNRSHSPAAHKETGDSGEECGGVCNRIRGECNRTAAEEGRNRLQGSDRLWYTELNPVRSAG